MAVGNRERQVVRRTLRIASVALLGLAIAAGAGGGRSLSPRVEIVANPRPVPAAPSEPVAINIDDLKIAERIVSLTLEQKIAQLMMIHCSGIDTAALIACASGSGVSGLIFMRDNIPGTPEELSALTASVRNGVPDTEFPLLIATDQEGGDVARLEWDTFAAGNDLAQSPVDQTLAAFTGRAELLKSAGISVNFGVVADVTNNQNSFIYDRVLGHDPSAAAERVAVAVAAETGRVASTLKHFPGHGAADGDSHVSIPIAPDSFEQWRGGAALPFEAGISAGTQLVMMAHVAFPAIDQAPASLSHVWHGILRNELGFQGVIVSDDLLMLQGNDLSEFADSTNNAVRALNAGTDLLLWVLPADHSAVSIDLNAMVAELANAVRTGIISPARIDEALTRVLKLRQNPSEHMPRASFGDTS